MMKLQNVCKRFSEGEKIIEILSDANLSIQTGEKIAIIGPSGVGKSTLLSLMAGLDTPDSGEILFQGKHIESMSEEELTELRSRDIGFVFQSFELVPSFTALENVHLPLLIQGNPDLKKAKKILKEVGLEEREHHYPQQLSGGEKQRVAIARALIHNPKVIFADEPTGNLDQKTGQQILDLLLKEVSLRGKTLIIITHDPSIVGAMDRVYEMKDRKLLAINS